MALEAVVVAVRMQQRVVVGDAEGGDQSIDGLADRHTLTTKSSVIPRRGDSNFATRERQKFQRPEQVQGAPEGNLGTETLQHLHENQITG